MRRPWLVLAVWLVTRAWAVASGLQHLPYPRNDILFNDVDVYVIVGEDPGVLEERDHHEEGHQQPHRGEPRRQGREGRRLEVAEELPDHQDGQGEGGVLAGAGGDDPSPLSVSGTKP